MRKPTEGKTARNAGVGSDRLRRRMARLGALAVVGVAIGIPSVGSAQTSSDVPDLTAISPAKTFKGSATAVGVRVTGTVPGAPATDDPIDGGGPTAQVALDSIGTSSGYAAFPDPGVLVVTGPGLAAGLLAGGLAGLPPITLPAPPPNYPFFVASDANTPEQAMGEGPYRLEAKSSSKQSTALASGGLQPDVVGNIGFASANASVTTSDVEVVSEATADLQALTIGPFSVGQVKSKAKLTLDSFGILTPSSSLEIVGMRIGNLPVALTSEGFVAAGSSKPFPVNEALAQFLGPSNMRIEFVAAQHSPDRVVAPALKITMPFAFSLAKGDTVMTLTVGSALAALSGASTEEGVASPEAGLPERASPSEGSTDVELGASQSDGFRAAPIDSDGVEVGFPAPSIDVTSGGLPPLDAVVSKPARPEQSTAVAAPAAPSSSVVPAVGTSKGAFQRFDIGGLYMAVVGGGVTAAVIGLLTRRLGVRRIWASLDG